MNYLVKSVVVLFSFFSSLIVHGKITIEEYSPLEDPATDIPRTYQDFRWIVSDKIGNKQISTNGAPIVRFVRGEPRIISSVPTGTELELTHVRSFKGINYWAITYLNDSGKERQGWISGMFLSRK